MADYYQLFSSLIECDTDLEKDSLLAALDASVDEDGEQHHPCLFERDDGGVWVYSEEAGDISRLADIVCRWQVALKIEKPWFLEYADTCSKPRLDGFSGGAVLCWHGQAHFMHTSTWLTDKIRELSQPTS